MKLRLTQRIGDGDSLNPKALIPEIELLRDYRRIQLEIGKSPSSADMQKHGKYDVSVYIRRYGSWSAFRKIVNNPISTNKVTKEQLIENFYAVKEKLGRVPTGVELGEHGQYGVRTYHKYFGGHRKLLEFLNNK
jgi:hypothetical protein